MWHALPPADPRLRRWLTSSGSLTRRICASFAGFHLRRVRQRVGRANADEAVILGVSRRDPVLVREVVLLAAGRPLVFGHTVVALRHLRGPWRTLRFLGSRPLAEALFLDPAIRREPLAYGRIGAVHPLYRRIAAAVGAAPTGLWARRSLFRRRGAPLLVTEVFLPGICGAVEPPHSASRDGDV
jgi:chorismate--pyruvate lyase